MRMLFARAPRRAVTALPALLVFAGAVTAQGKDKPGYTDTPKLPESEWRVHDAARPRPRAVATRPGQPPADAVVLFDGKDLSQWRGRGGEAKWRIEDGAMVVNGTGDLQTKQSFGDMQLHIEWSSPKEVKGDSQGRGNSGVFLMGRYEVQVLDSFQNPSYADGQAGAMYGQRPPLVNACRAPGEWQTYDIIFRAPRFKDGKLVQPAMVTVLHNGVLLHHAQEFIGGTAHRKVATYREHPEKAPLKLQDHGNPVRFRNIWVRPLGADAPSR